MLWAIEQYNPKGARGWVVTNDPRESARLLLFAYPSTWTEVDCNQMRTDVLASGAHENGLCGFVIAPDVMHAAFLSPGSALCENATRLVLHRHIRGRPFLNGRIFALTFLGAPASPAFVELGSRFRLHYPNAERMDAATRHALFALRNHASILVSGALAGDELERALDAPDFIRLVDLPDPRRLLAARLDLLRENALDKERARAFLQASPFARLAAELATLDPGDDAALEAWGRGLTEAERRRLSDPIVRHLSGAEAEAAIDERHLAQALNVLARFDAIGLAGDPASFAATVSELLQLQPAPAAGEAPLTHWAEALARAPVCAGLTGFDARLIAFVGLGFGAREPTPEQIAAVMSA